MDHWVIAPDGELAATVTVPRSLKLVAARVSGFVMDSTVGARLSGALVQLVDNADRGRSFTTGAGNEGRFGFDSVPAGEYLLGFMHPRLELLLLEPPARLIAVRGDTDSVVVTLTVPSLPTLRAVFCRAKPMRPNR